MIRRQPPRPQLSAAISALSASFLLALVACHGNSTSIDPSTSDEPRTPDSTAITDAPISVALDPEAHARLADIVAEVRVRAVHPIERFSQLDQMNTPFLTPLGGRIVEMTVVRHLKPSFEWPTIFAVVPHDLDPMMEPNGTARDPDPFAIGSHQIVFSTSYYHGPGDHDCGEAKDTADPNFNQIVCGFAIPYIIEGDTATSVVTGVQMSTSDLEAAIARGVVPRRPSEPDPLPSGDTFTNLDGLALGIENVGTLEA